MGKHPETAHYGYRVPHLILTGFTLGLVLLAAGVFLLAGTTGSIGLLVAGACGIVLGLAAVGSTAYLRWLVIHGRPRMTELMLDQVPWTGDERVLDVGCGPGLSLVAVARRLKTGRAVGLDKWMILHGERNNSKEIALENARIEGVADRVEVHDGDASAIPFEEGTFDVVVSSFVFHHMTREVRQKALVEIVRVTKPGGRILITDDNTGELEASLRTLGLPEVSGRTMIYPIHLLCARKAGG